MVCRHGQLFVHRKGTGSFSITRKAKNHQQSVNYSWAGNDILCTGPYLYIRKCVRDYEMYDILQACHDGPCGGHFSYDGR